MALMSLYVTAIIAYHLANSYKQDVTGPMSMALITFLIMTVQYTEDGGIDKTFFELKGLLVAMFASILVWYPLFKLYEKRYGKKEDTSTNA